MVGKNVSMFGPRRCYLQVHTSQSVSLSPKSAKYYVLITMISFKVQNAPFDQKGY